MADHSICHLEIPSTNTKKASEFYANLFGWNINEAMGEGYIFFNPENGPGGGISKVDKVEPNRGLHFYVIVDDIEDSLKKANDLGAATHKTKTEIPGHGWYGQFTDLDGNLIGLFTALKQ